MVFEAQLSGRHMVGVVTLRCLFSFGKQLYLARLIGDAGWDLDLSLGDISFGGKYRWRFQLLGTESETSNTWLWAWANAERGIPNHLLQASLGLKAYGAQHGIAELSTPQLSLDQIDGHTLALLASGICEAAAYYRCPYEGGALFVLIMDDNFPKCPDQPLRQVANVFPQAIASLDIPDHEEALCGYLDHFSLEHEHTESQTIVRDAAGKPVLTATFDVQKRLKSLQVKLDSSADRPDVVSTPKDGQANNGPDVGEEAKSAPRDGWDEAQRRRMMGF